MPSDRLEGVALVTGGGRGIGAGVARELAEAGMRVAVTARTAEQVEAVAGEIGGIALVGDVSRREDVERWVAELSEVDVLVANAGIGGPSSNAWETEPDEWWHVHEVKGEVAWIFCVPRHGGASGPELAREVAATVADELGKAFRPERILFVTALPKTRSAKVVRRAVRARVLGQDPGDLSSLENPEALEEITRAL